MSDKKINELIEKAAQTPHAVDPALLERIAGSLKPSLRPVRPLPPDWVLVLALVLIGTTVAFAGAAHAGFHGIAGLALWQSALLFPALAIFLYMAAVVFVSDMIPASHHRLSAGALLKIGSLSLLALFAALFHDYHTSHFVSAGIVCLLAGLLHAIPTGLASWLLLRRGFALHAIAAGLAAGTLAGLAGVTMLELHCDNFQALHVMLWHTAVIPVSAAAGAALAWGFQARNASVTRKPMVTKPPS